jgi:catechol 2,3-dioxygenase-like lactoylglutathione lyase family enzyme
MVRVRGDRVSLAQTTVGYGYCIEQNLAKSPNIGSGYVRVFGPSKILLGAEDSVSQRQIENTIPVLTVRDLNRSIAFFKEVLGFEVEWNTGDICSVARDGCSIMLQVQEQTQPGMVWVGLDGDALFSQIQSSQAMILQPPSRKPWAHEMKIADPDGNVIWLGADPNSA